MNLYELTGGELHRMLIEKKVSAVEIVEVKLKGAPVQELPTAYKLIN